jgi:LCP family protein required for cell wall assembly
VDGPEPTLSAESEPITRRRRAGMIARITGRCLVALASIAALTATAFGWAALGRLQGGVTTSRVLVDVPQAPPADDGATDILTVGNDSRTDAQGNPLPLNVLKQLRTESTSALNTDTLVLVRIPHRGGEPAAVSLPRDTSVPFDQHSEKINAVYGLAKAASARQLRTGGADPAQVERESNLAGQRALVQSVQTLTGARIDHYAEVNLLGFYEITKAVGGVEVCLNEATSDKDSGADFRAGKQTISGGDALAFVRQRHGLPRGDLDRIVRQQVFMAALANKVLSTGTLTDSAKLNKLTSAAQKAVVLDEEWDVAGFAQQMQGLAAGGVRFVTMPVTNVGARDDRGQSVVTVDPGQVRKFISDLAVATPPGPEPTRFGATAGLRLDGTAFRQLAPEQSAPITSGATCIN